MCKFLDRQILATNRSGTQQLGHELDQLPSNLSRNKPAWNRRKFDRFRSTLAPNRPTSNIIGPESTNIGTNSTKLGPEIGQLGTTMITFDKS